MTSNSMLDLNDIQGIIARGYSSLAAASYLLLSITDGQTAKPWLRDTLGQVTFADMTSGMQAVNIAMTHSGISKLNNDSVILDSFSNEFRTGMTTTHKQHILGDENESAPSTWDWGGPNTKTVDVLLLCYAIDQTHLDQLVESLLVGSNENGLSLIKQLGTEKLENAKEHFGFRDGIGQPFYKEFASENKKHPNNNVNNTVALGEILLGHENGYKRLTQRPMVPKKLDPRNVLSQSCDNDALNDLGLNGSYLVFRQLSQDVSQFWKSMQELEQKTTSPDPIRLASKMVGRWPSGTPLVASPDHDIDDGEDKNNFEYHKEDSEGLKCPLGSHIRRTNPRDSLEPEPGTKKSSDFSNRHRLLRRGRPYGKPFDSSMDPKVFLANLDKEDKPESRGLHFICLNANIGRQFEFVQHTWANNPNFNGLYKDSDPIIGNRFSNNLKQDQFTVQQCPARTQYRGLPSFVQMKGGGYFFVPSKRALTFLFS